MDGNRLDNRPHQRIRLARHNPAAVVAECSASGRLRGGQLSAVAELLLQSEVALVHRLIMQKYRADLFVIGPLQALQSALHLSTPRTHSVDLSITLG